MFEDIELRKGQPSPRLSEAEFKKDYKINFYDPRYREMDAEIEKLAEIAWKNYSDHRKAPITVKAGSEYADPDYDLSVEWVAAKKAIDEANRLRQQKLKILVINASPRNEHTCPGEISKSFRMMEKAMHTIAKEGMDAELLDLSLLTAQAGKKIYPCKACVSTAMPLCHWPCSCYPNHSVGQTHDWMNEIYAMWARASGIMIITPVHWYQAPSTLKLMMDRMVCADGGNPDPTSTHGKDAKKAKKLELDKWPYPEHLAGRAYSIVAHGDTIGAEGLRRNLDDWLTDLGLIAASPGGILDHYIGYYEPYATSHSALDKNTDFVKEVEIAAKSLVHQVELMRNEQYVKPDAGIKHPIKK